MSDKIVTQPSAPPSPGELVGDMVRLLTVERTGPDNFVGGQQKNGVGRMFGGQVIAQALQAAQATVDNGRSEEPTSELPSLMRISYAVFCLKKKKPVQETHIT